MTGKLSVAREFAFSCIINSTLRSLSDSFSLIKFTVLIKSHCLFVIILVFELPTFLWQKHLERNISIGSLETNSRYDFSEGCHSVKSFLASLNHLIHFLESDSFGSLLSFDRWWVQETFAHKILSQLNFSKSKTKVKAK